MIWSCEYDKYLSDPHFYEMEFLLGVAWFHDCYYDPYLGSPKNEEMSVGIFRSMTAKDRKSHGDLCYAIELGIELTAKHMEDVSQKTRCFPNQFYAENALLFMDLDMIGFADPADEYRRTSKLIRKEYYRTSDDDFFAGRLKFLQALQSKSKIYYKLPAEFEQRARANIAAEIAEIKSL